jgi:glucokinase
VIVGALDLGGTHVSSCRVSIGGTPTIMADISRVGFAPDAGREELLGAIVQAAQTADGPELDRWGVATPGPFDYERGICTIRGVGKLESLYGVDLRSELGAVVHAPQTSITFLNDAHAFALGEWWAGAARGHERVLGITLGSGLGSGFLERGRRVESGRSVPPGGELYRATFRGAAVEGMISRRALLARYGDPAVDVEEMAARAREGEVRACAAIGRYASDLAELLAEWATAFSPTCMVFGGSIARAWDLLSPPLERRLENVTVCRAERIDDAGLLGAAWFSAEFTRR